MNERLSQLLEIDNFIQKIDAEVTLVLQNLQWDRQQILKGCDMVTCLYDKGHSIPNGQKAEHEDKCLLRSQGYSSEDKLLPDPPDVSNVVKFDASEITQIIENAARSDPQFRKGPGIQGPQQPLSVDRLQSTFTSDERRAIHDAVVASAPAQEYRELDLKLPSGADKGTATANRAKSHAEVLAELRDMKRRRTKYRVVAKTKNYSNALRDVIQTQMELYSEVTNIKSEPDDNVPNKTYSEIDSNVDIYNKSKRDRYRDPNPTHNRRPKYEERDRSRARFNETDRDTRYSKDGDYKRRDRSYSTKRDREIKKERNEREIPYKTNRDRLYNNAEDFDLRDSSTSRNGGQNKYNESERNTRCTEDRRERDRSKSKYHYEERKDKHKNKYSNTSKYQNYNNGREYKDSPNDEQTSRRNEKHESYKHTASTSDRDGRYSKDRDGKRH